MGIEKEHVLEAIRQIQAKGTVPKRRNSRRYSLQHEGRNYPPKYLLELAHNAAGVPLPHPHGGSPANDPLTDLGFQIVAGKSDWNEDQKISN